MKEFEIRLRSVGDVQAFVSLATACPFSVLVSDDHHRVNGSSFMEMFCLDFSRCLMVAVDCSEGEFHQFRQDAARFLATE